MTGSFGWSYRDGLPVVEVLEDHGHRWGDTLLHRNGSAYRLVGDLHPAADQVLVETARQTRDGDLVRVSAGRFMDGTAAPRLLPSVWVPAYGRAIQICPLADAVTVIRGEQFVDRLFRRGPGSAEEQELVDTLTELTSFGVPLHRLGVQGSFARGTGKPTSDFDIDVYGPDHGTRLAEALADAVADTAARWRLEWPPRRRSVIDGLRRTSLADWDDGRAARFFTERKRAVFSFCRGQRSISIFFHAYPRDSRRPALQVAQLRSASSYDFVAEVAIAPRDVRHREDPAFLDLVWAECVQTGEKLTDVLLVSWARGLWFCLDGDVVTVRARPGVTGSGQPLLVTPDWGEGWPVVFAGREP